MDHFNQVTYKVWDLTDSLILFSVSTLLLNVKEWLWVLSLSLTVGYTVWKWVKEYNEVKNKKKK